MTTSVVPYEIDSLSVAVAAPRSGAALLRRALAGLLLSTTVLQSMGLDLGAYSLNTALVGMYACLAVASLSGALALSHRRLVLYVLALTMALASLLVNKNLALVDRSSTASLFLLAAMYLPFVFTLEGRAAPDARWVLGYFSNLCLVCALFGVAQFFAQFVIHARWLFDYSSYLPRALQGPKGFNTVIPVGGLFKSNGFFFREPSGFSYIMALALTLELAVFKRVWRSAAFALALLLTYSGTGLLALGVAALFPLGLRTLKRVGLLALGGAAALLLLGDALNLWATLGRLSEFGSERSSAYIRYVAPLRMLGDTLNAELWTPWLGQGPGAVFRQSLSYEFHDPTWAKLLVEYGVVGAAPLLALFLSALARSSVPISIRASLFFYWLIMGGHLLSPEVNFMTLALVGILPRALPSTTSARA
jgi:hypothetical protein